MTSEISQSAIESLLFIKNIANVQFLRPILGEPIKVGSDKLDVCQQICNGS